MQLQNKNISNITLNTEDLIFSVALTDDYYNILNDPTIFTIVSNYSISFYRNGSNGFESTILNRTNCTNIYKYY